MTLGLASCGKKSEAALDSGFGLASGDRPIAIAEIAEVSPPETIQALRPALENYQPQVTIVSPQPDQVLEDNTVSVELRVEDLPLFQDPELKMGPHLHVILDNQPYQAAYDLSQPLTFQDLAIGTHTLRVFASRPWHESFKNEGAYAQTTFHIFTKTQDNNPNATLPLLTYSRPKGSYGAEPILLDFYLANAPLHLVAQERSDDSIIDWQIRCTINGTSFIVDRWQPIYLKGFKPGKNWIQLELLDEQKNLIQNIFNHTARLVTFEPGGRDTLSKLIRGELQAADARSIVDPSYRAKLQAPSSPAPPATSESASTSPGSPTPIPQIPSPQSPSPETTTSSTESELEVAKDAQGESPASSKGASQFDPSEKSRIGRFMNRFRRQPPTVAPSPSPTPMLPESGEISSFSGTSTP